MAVLEGELEARACAIRQREDPARKPQSGVARGDEGLLAQRVDCRAKTSVSPGKLYGNGNGGHYPVSLL
jgi:hypothetical protein